MIECEHALDRSSLVPRRPPQLLSLAVQIMLRFVLQATIAAAESWE